MKWLVFTGACVAMLITLGALAVDERDVSWEGREAHCPYCRSDLPALANVCKDCDRSVDWVPKSEECRWSLSRAEINYMRDMVDSLELEEPLPEELAGFQLAYFRGMEEGACAYCAGLGMTLEGTAEVTCKVCRGRKRCIACDGDRVVSVGDPRAYWALQRRQDQRRRAEERAKLTGLPINRNTLLDEDVEALAGYAEIEKIVDDLGRSPLEMARARAEEAFRKLRKVYDAREKPKNAAPDDDS